MYVGFRFFVGRGSEAMPSDTSSLLQAVLVSDDVTGRAAKKGTVNASEPTASRASPAALGDNAAPATP